MLAGSGGFCPRHRAVPPLKIFYAMRLQFHSMLTTIASQAASSLSAQSISTSESVVGYTVLTTTNITGETEGADYDKLVKLDNGMIFEWNTYDYFYAYHPEVAVFAKSVTVNGKSFIVYKLVVEDEDEALDVTRIK